MTKNRESLAEACKEFEQDLVLYYYQDRGSATDQHRLESHLKDCASCRLFLDELKRFLPASVQPDEPSPAFWQHYTRELRAKLDRQESGWRERVASWFTPWSVPAMATAAILALTLTLTFTKGHWFQNQAADNEVTEIAGADLDFLKSLDFLDTMDLLEAVDGHEAHKSETSSHSL